RRLLPLAVGRRGRAQQLAGLGEALLAQAHRAQPAERLRIARARTQHLGEARLGHRVVALLQRAETLAQQALVGVLLRRRALAAQLRGLGRDLAVVRLQLEEFLVQRGVAAAGVEPQQGLAPGRAR